MADLTDRAERALLGALLLDPGQVDGAGFVAPADFAIPQHRAIFTTLASVCSGHRDGTRPPADLPVALAAKNPALSLAYVQHLAASCHHPQHAPAYARMVIEASLRRQLALHAGRLFQDAGSLRQQIGRLTGATSHRHDTEPFPGHLLKLAHSMLAHARGFAPTASAEPPGPAPERGQNSSFTVAELPAEPLPVTSGAATRPANPQARQEVAVLAGLIHHFWSNNDVLNWLPAEAFTPGPNRDIYQTIQTLAGRGEPVDELTVTWQAARDTTLAQATHPAGHNGAERSLASYVDELADLTVADGTATLTGRLLLERYAAAQVHTAQAEQAAQPGWAPGPPQGARPDTNRDHRPEHVPITTPGYESARSHELRPPRPGCPPLLQRPPGPGGPPSPAGPEPR